MEKNKLNLLIICAFILSLSGLSQAKYWVKFKNKTGTPYVTSNPSAFLSNKAIFRRSFYNIPIDQVDLPVNPSYVSQVDAISNVTILYVSKWLNGCVISIPNTAPLTAINALPFVQSSGQVNRYKIDLVKVDESISTSPLELTKQSSTGYNYGGALHQTKQLNLDCLHNQGYRGQDMTIAVMDAGFKNVNTNPVFDSVRNRGGILGTIDFVTGGTSVYEDDSHGALAFSCMAALKPGSIIGSAPLANYWLFRTEDVSTETISEEYNWIRAAEFADSVGVDVITTSLGYTTFDNVSQNHNMSQLDGKTAPMSIAANIAARKGILVLNSAGNGNGSSWPKIGIPADADSICAVGAIDSLSNVTFFSSIGPTSDGRIKPDLCARGGNAWVATTSGGIAPVNGTSFSCPILAGAMTCFWQGHKAYRNVKVIDTLKSKATFSNNPNNSIGWGVPNICSIPVINPPVGIKQVKNDLGLSIWPNPANTFIQLQSAQTIDRVDVYNVVGTLIETQVVKSNQTIILTDTWARGTYLIKVQSANGITAKKVLLVD